MAEKQTAVQKHRMIEKGQLDDGLAFVFGAQVVADSRLMTVKQMAQQAEQVTEAARQLNAWKGEPEEQRRIVECLDDVVAVALCKWIADKQAGRSLMASLRH